MTEKTGKTFELSDRATGKTTQLPVLSGTIGPAVLDIAGLYKDLDVFTYDPGFGATAACDSRITYIDGDAGVLLYRGYPIEQLAEKSSFMEVSYLILLRRAAHGEAARGVHRQHPSSHDDQRDAAALLQRLPPQRAPDGHGVGGGGLDVGVLSRHDGHP